MKVYIAGKITGDPDYGAKFKRAEGALREEGHTVINPAVLPAGLDPADYGRICFAMLDSADAVAFLDDYMDSPGAALEHEYSEYTDKKTMYIGDEYRAFEDQRIAPADALRGPTREQVRMGMWIRELTPQKLSGRTISHCSKCWHRVFWPNEHTNFCPDCGMPMTDEAVDIMMKRLEEMRNG